MRLLDRVVAMSRFLRDVGVGQVTRFFGCLYFVVLLSSSPTTLSSSSQLLPLLPSPLFVRFCLSPVCSTTFLRSFASPHVRYRLFRFPFVVMGETGSPRDCRDSETIFEVKNLRLRLAETLAREQQSKADGASPVCR
jgi:hypothetical protein